MMTTAELVRADHEAMLIVGALVSAQQDPASFERFTEKMFNEWERRTNLGVGSGDANSNGSDAGAAQPQA